MNGGVNETALEVIMRIVVQGIPSLTADLGRAHEESNNSL